MKALLSLLAMLFAINFAYAQTNTFPSSGNVGIGTTTPDQKLTLSAGSSTIFSQTQLGLYNPYTANADVRNWMIASDEYSYGSFGIKTSATQGSNPATGTVRFLIDKTGNVGIGTTSPQNKLDVQGGNMSIYNPGTYTGLAIGSGATGKTFLALSTSADAAGYGIITSISSSGSTYGNLAINPDGGNVGIGTTDPQGYKLAVNGSAIATSMTVKLHANWPDYVFKPQYHLPSLAEVKTYINQNQHLPDMPSESEVAKNGIDLGEMNKLLTKKVEELTLYLIEKDNQLHQQEALQKNQEDRIKALEKAVRKISQ